MRSVIFIFLSLGLSSCFRGQMRPLHALNDSLFQAASSYREPSLGKRWLVTLTNRQGKEKIELIDLRNRRKIALPGINRPDSQPISVSVSANGDRLAFVRQRADQTELLIYRRNFGTLQKLEISPRGIPRRVSLDASGKVLAVQVSRQGRWDVDVIRLTGS